MTERLVDRFAFWLSIEGLWREATADAIRDGDCPARFPRLRAWWLDMLASMFGLLWGLVETTAKQR